MSEELKECPFCGGKADLNPFTRKRWSVDCSACEAAMISCASRQDAIDSWNTRAELSAIKGGGEAVAYKCTPKNGGKPFVLQRAPDTWELRECDIEVVPTVPQDAGETNESIAADCYWHIADVMKTEPCWSVQEHVEFMREIVQDASEYLHDIPDSSAGGDDNAAELCRRIRLCLSGTAPGYTPPLYAPVEQTAPPTPTPQQISDYLTGLETIRREVAEREARHAAPPASGAVPVRFAEQVEEIIRESGAVPTINRDWICIGCGNWTPNGHPEAHAHEGDCTEVAACAAKRDWKGRLRALLAKGDL